MTKRDVTTFRTDAERHYASGEVYWVRRDMDSGRVVAISGPLHHTDYDHGQHPPRRLSHEDVTWANQQVFQLLPERRR